MATRASLAIRAEIAATRIQAAGERLSRTIALPPLALTPSGKPEEYLPDVLEQLAAAFERIAAFVAGDAPEAPEAPGSEPELEAEPADEPEVEAEPRRGRRR